MASIYDIASGFDTLWALLEEDVIDDESLEDAFDNLKDDLADKLENCCKYIKNEEATIAGLKEEEKRISAKRKAKENSIQRLKDLMEMAMRKAGEKKLVCGTFTTSLQKNTPKVVIDELQLENIPEKYLVAQAPTIDKKAMADALKEDPMCLDGIAHLEQTDSLRIR